MKREIFPKGKPVYSESLNQIRTNFIQHALKLNKFNVYGRVVSGFSLSYSSSDKTIVVGVGVGFTPTGKLVDFKRSGTTTLGRKTDEYAHLVYIRPYRRGSYQPVVVSYKLTGDVFDPYSYIKSGNLYVDSLAIGFIKEGRVFQLNRAHHEPVCPVGGLFLYKDKSFINYVTLRGCCVVGWYDSLYLKCRNSSSSNSVDAVVQGGRDEHRITSDNIPTLNITGETDFKGSHTHSYTHYSRHKSAHAEKKSSYSDNLISYNSELKMPYLQTGSSGGHAHVVYSLKYENGYADPIKLTPPCCNLAVVERKY
ncbi:hypothetical protein [Borrelia sp. RT1S]|uniref:hypothetical protein n=1 Tax=Borrelia sp. RT1S TaxID=2898580 RepID=UPI001E460CBD|nr:hypothetical protein [Borrelia sp. RT1S]UGQ17870.1 hypothetical protein LSO05_05410 [Borrelia sp. RT1S]